MSYGVTYTERVVYSRTLKYPCAVNRWRTKISTKGEGTFLHFPSTFLSVSFRSLLYSSVSLDHSAVFGETGIASYFPEEHWVNSRSESRDHRACKSKCMSAIFGVGSGRLSMGTLIKGDKGGGKMGGSTLQRIPISTKYEI